MNCSSAAPSSARAPPANRKAPPPKAHPHPHIKRALGLLTVPIVFLLAEFSGGFGGTLAVRELTEQIASMRNRSKASAMPIVELQSRQMKTDFGLKPRPHLQIVGWRFPDGDNIGHDESPPIIEQPNDPLPQF